MAQRYRPGVAHERMADGCCPECGKLPEAHAGEWSVPAMFAPCNLLVHGVIDRIEQYRSDSTTPTG